MERDPLLTPFTSTTDPAGDGITCGSNVDLDQTAIVSNTKDSSSNHYGSNLSWHSRPFFTNDLDKLVLSQATTSNYGSAFDSDDERQIATLLDDAENLTAPSVFATDPQDDLVQTVAIIPKIFSTQQSDQSGNTNYYPCSQKLDHSNLGVASETKVTHYSRKVNLERVLSVSD
jgi:hypothetical protein